MAAIEIMVPNIGDFNEVPVIEILGRPGDTVQPEDPLVTLESDKATMEVPAPQAGKVIEILVAVGDTVSEGSVILKLKADGASADAEDPSVAESASAPPTSPPSGAASAVAASLPDDAPAPKSSLSPPIDFGNVHASPSVRMIARELDIDLTKLTGSGARGG